MSIQRNSILPMRSFAEAPVPTDRPQLTIDALDSPARAA
jgi:hypothetical protein